MAGNFEKFIDRSPIICAAGKPLGDPKRTLKECLQNYRLQDEVDALKHDAGIFEEFKPPFKYKLPPLANNRHRGIYTEIQPILQPPVKTRFQTLINNLKETSYDSYWNRSDGKTYDPVPGLPPGLDITETTFGKPLIRKYTAKEVVNPPKTVYEVLWDSQVAHDKYIKSHNDYNPSEQINRSYLQPAFDPNKKYGTRTPYDPRGIGVKCACHWHNNEPLTTVNSIEADTIERLKPQVGKVLAPLQNFKNVTKGHRFGKPTDRPFYGMEELLKDPQCKPCVFKRDFQQWMKHLNELRVYLKRRFNKFGFDYQQLQDYITYYDKEYTGWVPLNLFYDILLCYGPHYEHNCLEPFFTFCGVIKDGMINYRDFIFLININNSIPEIIKIEDIPKGSQYYISSIRASACDFIQIDNSKRATAGVPSIRFDLQKTPTPIGGCKADVDHLGDETSAGAVINPSIYTNYGISHREFFMPRKPQEIRKIFINIGYEFPDNTFEQLWKIATERDKSNLVCIETFRNLLKETVPPSEFVSKKEDIC